MTATLEKSVEVRQEWQPLSSESRSNRLADHIFLHRTDFMLALVLAVAGATTRILNISGYPRLFTDENVYVAQSWAVQFQGTLANYTYWYDHPPLGWIQLSLWSMLTGSLERQTEITTMAGREYMVVMAVVTTVLTFVLARKLGLRRSFAVLAAGLYVLSPLAVSFSRYVLLDNIAVAWLLAAMVLALSPTRKLSAAIWCGVCLAVAALSKETALLVAPAVIFMLVRNYWRPSDRSFGPGNRGYAIIMSLGVSFFIMLMYPLYAMFKNELIPGPDHVSLFEGQIMFQLASREGSGSILDPNSNARLLAENAWTGLDAWLPIVGIAAIVPALFIRKLWGPMLALLVQVLVLVFRDGYLPYPFIIMLLPFMALLIGGVANAFWPSRAMLRGRWYMKLLAVAGTSVVTIMAFSATAQAAPDWYNTLKYQFTANETANQVEALDWVQQNISPSNRLVTEGEYWLDLHNRGFNQPPVIWTYKLDTDSAVQADYGDVSGLDVLVLNRPTVDATINGAPSTLQEALEGATLLATFGPDGDTQVQVLKVNNRH